MATKPELKELGDFLNPVLGIPIGGKTYRVNAMPAQDALVIESVMTSAAQDVSKGVDPNSIELASDDDEATFTTRVLGSTYQEMLDGGVSLVAIKHVIAIVLAWTFADFEKAQEYWRAGGKVRPARKAPTDRKPKTVTPTSTGEGTTTH